MNLHESTDSRDTQPRIKAVGIGATGARVVDGLIERGMEDIDFTTVATDAQPLGKSRAATHIQIGEQLTKQFAASGYALPSRMTDETHPPVLQRALAGAELVFIIAGMGDAAVTGTVLVVASIARTLNALSVGVVTTPSTFAGMRRRKAAEQGIAHLQPVVDALIVIPEDRLLQIAPVPISRLDASRIAGMVMGQGIQALCELVTRPGLINLELDDLKVHLTDSGPALLALGHGLGDDATVTAAHMALSVPLTDLPLGSANSVLFNICGGEDLGLQEIYEAADTIVQATKPDAVITFGVTIEPSLREARQIVLLATGFGTG